RNRRRCLATLRRAILARASIAALRWRWSRPDGSCMARRSGPTTWAVHSRRGFAHRSSTIPKDGGAMAELPWSSPAVSLAELQPARQVGLRLRPPFPAYLARVPLPLTANGVAATGPLRVLWLGPDEWLVVTEGEAPELMPRLERAVAGRRAALNDLSSSRVIIELRGTGARALLAAGCGLDLHPR